MMNLGSDPLLFFVPGSPAPQGSKRHVGHGRMIESSKAVGPWRERVALAAHDAMRGQPMFDKGAPLAIAIEFVMPRPASTPKGHTPPAVKRPDSDKLSRAVHDAMTGIVYPDDSAIVVSAITKRLAEIGEVAGAHIFVIAERTQVNVLLKQLAVKPAFDGLVVQQATLQAVA